MRDIYTTLLAAGIIFGVYLLTFFNLVLQLIYNERKIKMFNQWLTETGQHDKYEKWKDGKQSIFFWLKKDEMKEKILNNTKKSNDKH